MAPAPLFRIAASQVDDPIVITIVAPPIRGIPVDAVATTALDVPSTRNTGVWLKFVMSAMVGVPVVGIATADDAVLT
jgi:hypothetical protein